MANILLSTPVMTPAYFARAFFELNKQLTSDRTDVSNLTGSVNSLNTLMQFLLSQLVRAAVVETAIAASSGYPNIGAGTIRLISLADPAVKEDAILPAYNFFTPGYAATTVVFVVSLNNSYFVIAGD